MRSFFAVIFMEPTIQLVEYVMVEYEKDKRLNLKPVGGEEVGFSEKAMMDLKFAPAMTITDKSIICCCGKQVLTLTTRHLAYLEISVDSVVICCSTI